MRSLPRTTSPTVDPPPSGTLEITVAGGDPRTLQLRGDVDWATAPALRTALLRCRRHAAGVVVLDLDGVTLLSAAALTVLVEAHHRFSADGGRLLLTRPTLLHRRILAVVALDEVLVIEDV